MLFSSLAPLRRKFLELWDGSPDLPRPVKLERRLVLGRWIAIAFCAPALGLYQMPPLQHTAAFTLLGVALIYNFALFCLIRREHRWVADGSIATFGDGVLCAAMIAIVGGFESPFYVLLYAIVISAGMRLGFARGMVLATPIAVVDAMGKLSNDQPIDAAYTIRSGVLFLTVLLTSYLYEEAHTNEAMLAERLHQSEVLNTALEHQALHDLLTDLPNRSLLHSRLEQSILARAGAQDYSVALLLIDLDRFKEVNDTFGHQHGDLLLQEIGPRLRDVLGPHDTIARLGGDEFAVLLPRATALRAERVARRLLSALDQPFEIDSYSVDVNGSIGIALNPDHGDTADVLIQRADIAMYVAKRSNRGFAFYAPEHDQHTPDRLALVGELRRAIDNDELTLVYQPKVNLETGRWIGAEALIRWQHPQRGMISPDQFIPLAEQTGLIRLLSRWVLSTALRQVRAWQGTGVDLPIAVNLSMRDLHDPELPDTVAELLSTWQVAPSRLMVEITENGLMAEPARALQTVTGLRAMGIRIAIDDFGTGYSSLAYLKRLPVDELKIDRSFVRELAGDRDDLAIVRSTISLGHDLGLRIVAEGVEDAATMDLLQELGCDIGQGYHIGKPVAAHDLERQFMTLARAAAAA
ncbi:MAG TPA: EAL domain-containing protein [Chloroflexota bacterium]